MDEQGVDRAIMWPTLASVLEERLADDPEATHAVVHSLNQWMYDEWTFNYEDRIFAVPVITLPIVDEAIKELDWLAEHGAKVILIRPAPVPSLRGYRSFALPEFDPFWSKVEEYNITVGMHSSDDGMTRYFNQWEGHFDEPCRSPTSSAFQDIQHYLSRGIFDAMASAVVTACSPGSPKLRILPVENGSSWVLPLIEAMGHSYAKQPASTSRTPLRCSGATSGSTRSSRRTRSTSSRRSAPSRGLRSDFPTLRAWRPRLLRQGPRRLSEEDIRRIMGGNLAEALKLPRWPEPHRHRPPDHRSPHRELRGGTRWRRPPEPDMPMTELTQTAPRSPSELDATPGTPPPAPRALSRKGRMTRARLLAAAKEIFEEDGFLEARISDIAERAGLSHGSFYTYFDSKEQVFREVALAVEDELGSPVGEVILAPGSTAPPSTASGWP